ncbi:MAG: TRAP transporter substrate-binding protein [Treponema sp.]|nr:TRAP transporter substrate-binding protein [Treponema sp.]
MKKHFFAVFLLSFLTLVFSCNDKDKTVTLVMAELNPDGSISAQMDEFFVQKVDELSNGKIKIQLHTAGILGDNVSVLKILTQPNGEIHLARVSPAALVEYGCPNHQLLDVPFTFSNHNHFWNFSNSSLAEKILDEPYKNNVGVKGLFFGEEGFRHFFSTKPLLSIEDFAGKKLRTAGTEVVSGIARSLGSEPVQVNFSTLYSALQTGIADIAEQPIANYYSNHFNKVAPYMILDGHQMGIMEVVISSQVWDSLSEQNQGILLQAGKLASEFCNKITQENEHNSRELLEGEGVQFTEVADISAWQKACANLINSIVDTNTQLYGEIITLAD